MFHLTTNSMIVRIVFLFMIPVLFASCKEESEPVDRQLLINSSIEEGDNRPNGWIFWESDGTGLEFTWTDQESVSAAKSLQISNTSNQTEVWGYWGQLYDGDIPHGKDVELSVQIRGENLEGQGVAIAVRADRQGQPTNGQFSTTQGSTVIDGTFDWTTYKVTLANIEPDVYQLYVFLVYTPATTGEVFFDDAVLTVVE